MLPRNDPDRIQIAFDDHRLVSNAGLILPSTLALHLGLPQLVDRHLDLGDAPGRANTGDKMMTGGFRPGWGRLHRRRRRVAHRRDGCHHRLRGQGALHVGDLPAQLPLGPRPPAGWRVSRELLARAWAAGAGPGDGPLTIDLDSTIWPARPTVCSRRARATMATPASGAITRCWSHCLRAPGTC